MTLWTLTIALHLTTLATSWLPVAVCQTGPEQISFRYDSNQQLKAHVNGLERPAQVSVSGEDRCRVSLSYGGESDIVIEDARPFSGVNQADYDSIKLQCDFSMNHFIDLCRESYFKGAKRDHFKDTKVLGKVFRGDLKAWDHARSQRLEKKTAQLDAKDLNSRR